MAKLKYDRPITVSAETSSVINVPNDEVWKISAYQVESAPVDAPRSLNVKNSTSNVVGGGGKSAAQCMSLVSLSSTSKSKQTHGGGSLCLSV